VVPERDRVGAGGEQPFGEAGGQADSVRGVLAVDDAEIDVELLTQRAEAFLDGATSRRPEDVGDEEQLQDESVAAG